VGHSLATFAPGWRPGVSMFRHVAILMLAILVVGCGPKEVAQQPAYQDKPAESDHRIHYVFGVHPLHNPQLLHEKFSGLMRYLDDHLPGVVFDLDTSNDYAQYEQKLRDKKHQFSLPNPYHAALARDWGFHIIAKMGNDDLFRGIFVVRKDSPIKTPADLRGKVVSYPAPTALAAAMMPRFYLQQQGIDVETEIRNSYVGTHNSSIMNAYLGESAAGATWPVAWKAFQKANPKEASELYVIWQTPKLIQNAIIARNDVPADIADKVTQLLVDLDKSPEGRAILENIDTSNFVVATNADYDVVTEFVKAYDEKVMKRH
jgi:phosphonate transport system substrate-binding protein